MSNNKRTRSFRCSDTLWTLIAKTADDAGKKPSEVVTEALAAHCGDLIRKDRQLTGQQVTSLVIKLEKMEAELLKMKDAIGNERKNQNTG